MADQVYMDVPAVLNMGQRLDEVGDVLTNVGNALEMGMTILKTTAFVGLIGGVAVERFLGMLKPVIDELAEKSFELGRDLRDAATAFQNGDELGATKFH
ncbi:MAG: hypothetical protein ACPG8W_23765 [Candidatus Promineifilaceae bacterium]